MKIVQLTISFISILTTISIAGGECMNFNNRDCNILIENYIKNGIPNIGEDSEEASCAFIYCFNLKVIANFINSPDSTFRERAHEILLKVRPMDGHLTNKEEMFLIYEYYKNSTGVFRKRLLEYLDMTIVQWQYLNSTLAAYDLYSVADKKVKSIIGPKFKNYPLWKMNIENYSKFRNVPEVQNWIVDSEMRLPMILNKVWKTREKNRLKIMNDELLNKYKNAIFAKYGRSFNDSNLQEFFNKKKWYKINESYNDTFLTEIDRINLKTVLSEINSRLKETEQ